MILFLLPAVLASATSVIDLVNSNLYSRLSGIGAGKCTDRKLHPDEYVLLHSEHRTANFRGLWKGWCKSLSSRKSFEAAKSEIGEEKFWKIVNGECLFLGPMKWMTLQDVKAVKCAPLLNVPFTMSTLYVVPDEAMLVALFDKSVEYKSNDSLSFLYRESKNILLIENYAKKLSWDHPHWEVFSGSYYHTIDITRRVPPPEKLNAQNLLWLLKTLPYLMTSKRDKSEVVRQLEASPLKDYAVYLGDKPRSWEHIETAFNSIPESDHFGRILWARANISLVLKRPSSDTIRFFVEHYPALHPISAIFASAGTKYADNVPVPEWFMVIAEDKDWHKFILDQFQVFSLEEQVKFLSWNSRALPPTDEFLQRDFNVDFNLNFGTVLTFPEQGDDCIFPSINAYKKIAAKFESDISAAEPKFYLYRGSQIVEMALAYGFPLSLSSSTVEYMSRETCGVLFGNIFLSSHTVRRRILEYMASELNSQKLSQVKANEEVIGLIKVCTSPLSSLSKEQLSSLSTDHVLKYLRRQCLQVQATRGLEIAKPVLNLSDDALLALFKNRTEEDKEQIIVAIPRLDRDLVDATNELRDKIRRLIAAELVTSETVTESSTINTHPTNPKNVTAKEKQEVKVKKNMSEVSKVKAKEPEVPKVKNIRPEMSKDKSTGRNSFEHERNDSKYVSEFEAHDSTPNVQAVMKEDGFSGGSIIAVLLAISFIGVLIAVLYVRKAKVKSQNVRRGSWPQGPAPGKKINF